MMTRIGGFCAQHGAHLHRRGVRAQQHPRAVRLRREIERVVHLARRMAFGEIQLGEVVVVGLDVRTFGDREAHVGEDRGEFVDHLADRMDAAGLGRRLAHRQRDVDGLGGEPRIERGVLAALRARAAIAALTRSFRPLIAGPLRLALVRRHAAERLEQRRDRAALAERRDAHGFERGLVGGGGDGGRRSRFRVARCRSWRSRCVRPSSSAKADDPVTLRSDIDETGGYWMPRFRGA